MTRHDTDDLRQAERLYSELLDAEVTIVALVGGEFELWIDEEHVIDVESLESATEILDTIAYFGLPAIKEEPDDA